MREFYIAGVQHHQLHKVIDDLEEGMELELVPEPTNKFDPNAIRIEHEGTMLGYVPKKFSSDIAALIELGADVLCEITKVAKNAKPWEMCKVLITTEDDEDEGSEPESTSDYEGTV